MARVLNRLRREDSESRHSPAHAKQLVSNSFEIMTSSFNAPLEIVMRGTQVESDFPNPFYGEHVKSLLREAIAQFAKDPSSDLRLSILSRHSRSVPSHIEDNITEFLLAARELLLECCVIVASALVVDAFPTDMPYFPPTEVFDGLYEVHISAVEAKVGVTG
ncbi:hypothetical protein MY10362_004771 [Beauveria mimosiformis]